MLAAADRLDQPAEQLRAKVAIKAPVGRPVDGKGAVRQEIDRLHRRASGSQPPCWSAA